jgi:hypothetical protein
MSKKIDRALYGPSWTEVIFGALLSIVLGVVLAAAHLITKPVATVKEMPKEPVAGTVYHIEGSKDATKGRSWMAKRQQLVAGMSVTVSEEELNTAVTAINTPAPKKAGAKEEPAAEPTKPGAFTPGAPNFRIRDQELQIAVPVTINTLDLGLNVLVQARGDFEKQGDQFVFTPRTLLVGSCPVEKIPGLTNVIMQKFVGAQKLPEDISGAWAKLANVAIDGTKLKLDAP